MGGYYVATSNLEFPHSLIYCDLAEYIVHAKNSLLFLADRTNGRAYATVFRLSVVVVVV